MNKKLRELLENINNKKAEARSFKDEGKLAEAKAMIEEIKNLQEQFEIEMALVEENKRSVQMENKKVSKKEASLEVKAFRNALFGKPLTEEMKNVLVTSTGDQGGYLVPTELVNEIQLLRRQFVSLKDLAHVVPVKSQKGSMPIEQSGNFSVMVDFDEINDLSAADIKFNNVTFSIANKGCLVPMSNSLLSDEQAGLPSYVIQNFARKQIRTENADILAILQAKTAKAFTDIKSLKKSFNKDIDPGLKGDGFAWIMNQDAFGKLDDEQDAYGRPLLQPNPTQSTGKLLFGFPVVVLSNQELPTVSNNAPIIFGNLQGAVAFFDRQQYEIAASTEAGFTKNQTILRCISRFDVQAQDSDAFVNGTIDVSTYLA